MSSQWRNASVMAACVSGSASLNPPMVLSEKTTPQPKVLSVRFRSVTVISHDGLAFLAKIEKYNPAGPPPRQAILMSSPRGARQSISRRYRPLERLRAIPSGALARRVVAGDQEWPTSWRRSSAGLEDKYLHIRAASVGIVQLPARADSCFSQARGCALAILRFFSARP